jgi:adenylosuccinate lyase
MEAWKGHIAFEELVSKEPLVTKHLSVSEIRRCFDPAYYVRHLDHIYRRVFGSTGRRRPNRRRR